MERKNNRGRGNNRSGNNGRAVLYAVMAAFCILALIEIIYGRLHSQAKQDERVVQEQEDNDIQIVQELKPETKQDTNGGISGNGSGVNDSSNADKKGNVSGNENSGTGTADIPDIPLQGESTKESEEENEAEQEDNTTNQTKSNDMQIVFMGDSILDSVREYDGVAYLISKACNADVYNMAIGGTTAALMEGEEFNYDNWTSCSLVGIVHAILGDIDGKIFEPYRAGQILKECDFSKTDYFVIEYGINDFLAKIPCSPYNEEGERRNIDKLHTYVGAVEAAIGSLHSAFPTAKIILVSPHYCQFFAKDGYVGDTYSLDYGYGRMIDYSEVCGYIYNEHKDKNVIYFNSIMDSGIDAYSADDYLEDGIHLSSAGRRAYADAIAKRINADFRRNE